MPSVKQRLNEVLGKKANQFVSSLISLTNNNKLLAKADPNTVVASAMVAATLDLPINQSLGFAYIVPYKDQAQFQLGYKGLIQLAMRSGQFKTLNDFIVPNGALKDYNPLTGHVDIDFDVEDNGKEPDGYGVYMALTNGFEKTVFWSLDKVQKHAKRFSQAYSKGYESPWKSDFDAMALKTVIKHTLGKYAPLSVDMQRGIEADQGVIDIDGNVTQYPDNEPEKTPDPFQAAKKVNEVTDENIDADAESQKAPDPKPAKKADEPEARKEYPPATVDDLVELMMDPDNGLRDATVRKAAIMLGILPKDYDKSTTEASDEQISEIVGRWPEILKLKMK